MRALDQKLLRDLARLKTQAVAIALVVASAVALFLASATTYRSLQLSKERYYRDQRFADVWARVTRAPEWALRQIAAVPGVTAVEGRIVSDAVLTVPGLDEPATGLLQSIATRTGHSLDNLHLRAGRQVERGPRTEAVVNEAFAEKNQLRLGDTILVTVAGQRIALHIVGVALSPEYVMLIPPGATAPDDRRFGVLWMEHEQLATLLGFSGAVNAVALRVSNPAFVSSVIAAVDRLLQPYGGRGAYGRKSQVSHVVLEDHIAQLEGLTVIVPTIFLAVAAFLVNMVLSRLIGTQRSQLGMLKAFGYSNARVAVHYLELALAIVLAGIIVGVPVGVWLGRIMAVFYATFFRFPALVFRLEPGIVVIGVLGTAIVSVAGAFGMLRRVAKMPPVVAMAPAAPVYRPTWLDRLGLPRALVPAARMIVRNMTRSPTRALLTMAGMSLAVALLVLGAVSTDSINRVVEVQFMAAQREDLSVVLAHARSVRASGDFAALPGVRRAEPYRLVPARILAAGRYKDVSLIGLPRSSLLRRIVSTDFNSVEPPSNGVLIGAWTAVRFGIHRGELIAVEIREGRRRTVTTRVVGLVDEPYGSNLYLDLETLGRLLEEPETFSAANLLIDPARQHELYDVLRRAPQVIGVQSRRGALAGFRSMSDASLRFVRRIVVLFSVIIAFGVVYNATRIALAERAYELATLRVLGFRRAEISTLLLGEVGFQAVLAVPIGFAFGYGFSALVSMAMSSDQFRMPLIVQSATFGFAFTVFALASIGSALLVRRRLDRLDLIAVLKARE